MVAPERKKTALISVLDKTGVVEFTRFLVAECDYQIVSTGGTLSVLLEGGVPAIDVSLLTGVPEMLGGLVKTLTHHVHAGLLANLDNPEHVAELHEHGIAPIDLVYFHLYDVEGAAADVAATLESIRTNTDMGGVAALRSAAKGNRLLVSHPRQLEMVMQGMQNGKEDDQLFRYQLSSLALEEVMRHVGVSRRSYANEVERLSAAN